MDDFNIEFNVSNKYFLLKIEGLCADCLQYANDLPLNKYSGMPENKYLWRFYGLQRGRSAIPVENLLNNFRWGNTLKEIAWDFACKDCRKGAKCSVTHLDCK